MLLAEFRTRLIERYVHLARAKSGLLARSFTH
jgi:hypothetical protein